MQFDFKKKKYKKFIKKDVYYQLRKQKGPSKNALVS